ncbi:hypothetical protein EVAR_33947_1 [Eumeta japonica]|uniref:Uncharacterized protein n=1 Tax=Eumeta variegata TaxID=151549 RepID=A0A4C1VYU8_EUMVA|nr:hypothetical protein EVAR_33947_1 [Eumeta japonica]
MRAQLKVPSSEDAKLVEFAHIYQDINAASRRAELPKFKLETIFTAALPRGAGGRYPFLITRKASCIFMCFFFCRRFKQGGRSQVTWAVGTLVECAPRVWAPTHGPPSPAPGRHSRRADENGCTPRRRCTLCFTAVHAGRVNDHVRAIPKYLRSLLRERPLLHYSPAARRRPGPRPHAAPSAATRRELWRPPCNYIFNLSSLANTMEAPPATGALPSHAEYCIRPLKRKERFNYERAGGGGGAGRRGRGRGRERGRPPTSMR